MPRLIRTVMRSTLDKNTRTKETNNKANKIKKHFFTAEPQYLNLKAPSNVNLPSEKTLTAQTFLFLLAKQMEVLLTRLLYN